MDWTGILSVVESQEYARLGGTVGEGGEGMEGESGEKTAVVTTVVFKSRLGDRLRARATRKGEANTGEVEEEKKGFLASWGKTSIQRSIEAMASMTTETQLGKSKEGMNIVLARMRNGGLVGVLEGMRKDRELAFGSGKSQG